MLNCANETMDQIITVIAKARVMEKKDDYEAFLYLMSGLRRNLYDFEMKIREEYLMGEYRREGTEG